MRIINKVHEICALNLVVVLVCWYIYLACFLLDITKLISLFFKLFFLGAECSPDDTSWDGGEFSLHLDIGFKECQSTVV